jgi:predicted alpha/beta superfamily hydrolase
MESRILNETRRIFVSTPATYHSGNGRYAVLYVLDGERQFQQTSVVAKFLASSDRIPELIVVAIENTDRNRDLMPSLQAPDGANGFLKYIRDELKPWMDKNYRTNPYDIIVGHSVGGLFAIQTLTTQPDIFDAYIAISPSFQLNEDVLDQAEMFFESAPELNGALFLGVGNEGGGLLDGMRKLAEVLDRKSPKGFRWDFNRMVTESHDSVPLQATYRGLEMIFDSWDVVDSAYQSFAQGRLGVRFEEIEEIYRDSGEQFGYERQLPWYLVVDFAKYLTDADRLDEAAALLLGVPYNYPTTPGGIERLTIAYINRGDREAATNFFDSYVETLRGPKVVSNLRQLQNKVFINAEVGLKSE